MADYSQPGTNFLQGVQVGTSAYAQGLANSVRLQQLKAQQSMQAFQERQMAVETEMLTERVEQLKQGLREKAEQDTRLKSAHEHFNNLRKAIPDMSLEEAAAEAYLPIAMQNSASVDDALRAVSVMSQVRRKQEEDKALKEFTPSAFKDPTTGVTFAQEGPGKYQAFAPSQNSSSDPADIRTADIITGIQQDIAAATDPAVKAQLEQRLSNIQAQTARPGTTIFDPNTGKPIVQIGGKSPTDLTQPNVTKLQESLQSSLNSIDVVNRLEPLISEETVGVRAFAKGIALDRVLGQAFPELASKDRAEAKDLIAQLRASRVAALKSDGNISDKERNQIMEAVPGINDPLDSPMNALNVLSAIKKSEALSSLTKSQKLGTTIPIAAAQVLDDSDLVRAYKSGLITEQTALAAFRLKREQ